MAILDQLGKLCVTVAILYLVLLIVREFRKRGNGNGKSIVKVVEKPEIVREAAMPAGQLTVAEWDAKFDKMFEQQMTDIRKLLESRNAQIKDIVEDAVKEALDEKGF